MGRRSPNPWDGVRPGFENDLGRAVIHVAIEAGGPFPRSFDERDLLDAVQKLASASVVFQVGITKSWGRERSAQVILVNGGAWVQRWPQFEAHARSLARQLCVALQQEAVLLETWSRLKGYSSETWSASPHTRKKRAKALATGRGSVNPGARPRAVEWQVTFRPLVLQAEDGQWVLCGRIMVVARTSAEAARKAGQIVGTGRAVTITRARTR